MKDCGGLEGHACFLYWISALEMSDAGYSDLKRYKDQKETTAKT